MTIAEQRALIARHHDRALADLAKDVERACETGYVEHIDAVQQRRIYLGKLLSLDDDLQYLHRTIAPPFVRESSCPSHDSRCTAEWCILDPARPQP